MSKMKTLAKIYMYRAIEIKLLPVFDKHRKLFFDKLGIPVESLLHPPENGPSLSDIRDHLVTHTWTTEDLSSSEFMVQDVVAQESGLFVLLRDSVTSRTVAVPFTSFVATFFPATTKEIVYH